MLCSVVVKVAKAADVVRLFFATTALYGLPASVLSDNGAIYTSNYRESHSGLEIDLALLGITFKHGKPYHPQTEGKLEPYHQTLKKWLRKQPAAATIDELQRQIDGFVRYYNEQRPHRARGCPPMHAWRALDKATPTRRDLVARNVAALCDLRRTKPKEGRSLTPEQAARLLAVAPSDRLGITVELGLYLGLRPGEVLGLQWGDIDFDQRTLHVRRSLKCEQNELRFGEPKTPGSRRILAMPDPLVTALQRHHDQQVVDREQADDMWTDFDLVVTTEVGTPIDPSNARRTLDRLCDKASIGHWNPNALRHSFASLLSLRGAPMEEVADAMGHVDTRMTSRVYRRNLKTVVDVAAIHVSSLR